MDLRVHSSWRSSQARFPPVFPAFHINLFLLASNWCAARPLNKKGGLSVRLQLAKPPIPHRSLPERKQASILQSCLSLHIQTAEASSHVSRENIRNHSSAGNPLLGVPSWVVDGKHENKMMRHTRKSGIIIVGYILTAPNQYSYSEVEISCGLSF